MPTKPIVINLRLYEHIPEDAIIINALKRFTRHGAKLNEIRDALFEYFSANAVIEEGIEGGPNQNKCQPSTIQRAKKTPTPKRPNKKGTKTPKASLATNPGFKRQISSKNTLRERRG